MGNKGEAWGAALTVGGGVFGMIMANNQYNEAQANIQTLNTEMKDLENSRTPIINPYSDVTDTSSQLTNVYADLSVATQAADMQIEEADIALANTLDTMRQLGQGAGGATALAQMALKSKQGVSASIEQQEVANEKLRAQGEQSLQQAKMEEQQRLQQAEVAGKQFEYAEQDKRDMQQLDRKQAEIDQQRLNEATSQQSMYSMLGSTIGGLSSVLGA
jgi:hypothetical protein